MKYEEINSLDSENGIIATLIHHPNYSFFSEFLLPNHFTREDNQIIYVAISKLAQHGIGCIDPYNIIEILNSEESTKKYSEKLTVDRLYELIEMSSLISRETVEEYQMLVRNVMDAAFRRDVLRQLKDCQQLCYNRDINDIEQKIYSVLDGVMLDYSRSSEMPQYKDVIDDMWEKIKARQRGETSAIEFPFPALNEYVVMEPGELICFGAPQKCGKSAILLTCTVDMLRKGKSVLYIDSEISTELFTVRILSHLTGIRFTRLRSGNYTCEEEQLVEEAVRWLKSQKFIHVYLPLLDANTMYLMAKKAKHTMDIDCIVVDYLKADSSKEEAFGVYANLGAVTDTLKNKIAGEMGICALTAAQATSAGKLADSARIARSASTVIMLQDKSLEEIAEMPDCGVKKMRVRFNRNGSQMSEEEWIDMDFDGSTCTYTQAKSQHGTLDPF